MLSIFDLLKRMSPKQQNSPIKKSTNGIRRNMAKLQSVVVNNEKHIKQHMMDMCKSYFSTGTIVGVEWVGSYFIISDENNVYIWEYVRLENEVLFKYKNYIPAQSAPISSITLQQQFLFIGSLNGQLRLIPLPILPQQIVYSPVQTNFKGRETLNYTVLLKSKPIYFNLAQQSKWIPSDSNTWIPHQQPLVSVHLINFQEQLILTISTNQLNLWTLQLKLIGSIDLITNNKLQWNIKMLNKQKKESGLLSTLQLINTIIHSIDTQKTNNKIRSSIIQQPQKQSMQQQPIDNDQSFDDQKQQYEDIQLLTPEELQNQLYELQLSLQSLNYQRKVSNLIQFQNSQQQSPTNKLIPHNLNKKLDNIYNSQGNILNFDSSTQERDSNRIRIQKDLVQSLTQRLPDYIEYYKNNKKDEQQANSTRKIIRQHLQRDLSLKHNTKLIQNKRYHQSFRNQDNQSTQSKFPQISISAKSNTDDNKEYAKGKQYLNNAREILEFLQHKNQELGI